MYVMYNDDDYCMMHYNITLQKLPSHEGQSTVQHTNSNKLSAGTEI